MKMLTCIACGTKDQSQMTQRPMAMCAQEKDQGLCISCAQKMDNAQNLVRSMMQMSGLGRKKLSDDDPLFQDPPPKEDCPICMLPMPVNSGVCDVHTNYQSCCGKIICCGCVQASRDEIKRRNKERSKKKKMEDLCPFCRVPDTKSDKEEVKRLKQRIKSNEDDAEAFLRLGNGYNYELWGLKRDRDKAFELYSQAAKLGSVQAHDQIAKAHKNGFVPGHDGANWDMDKAQYHMELAAMGGHEAARHNLGLMEKQFYGSSEHAMKHFMIAASSGFELSLKEVGEGYKAGHVSKEDYTKTLRAYQNTREEMKSEQRTKVLELYSSTYKQFQSV